MKGTSIITVNYNQPALTILFLQSLRKFTVSEEVQVIVVDNGSKEDCGELFRQTYSGVVYVRSEKNLGFAGGNNLGTRYATGEYVLFLNNDTEITDGFVNRLSEELKMHPEIGLLSPLILFFDDKNKIQYAGFTNMNFKTGRNSAIGVMETDAGQYDTVTAQTGFCHGAAMICRRADLEEVGLMDDSYFLYYEELDWCEKFKRAGKQIAFTGKAKIYHKESMSVGRESALKTYFMTRNRWLFIRRNTGHINTYMFSIYYLLVVVPWLAIKYGLKKRPDLVRAVWKGAWWNITHRARSKDLGIKIPAL